MENEAIVLLDAWCYRPQYVLHLDYDDFSGKVDARLNGSALSLLHQPETVL